MPSQTASMDHLFLSHHEKRSTRKFLSHRLWFLWEPSWHNTASSSRGQCCNATFGSSGCIWLSSWIVCPHHQYWICKRTPGSLHTALHRKIVHQAPIALAGWSCVGFVSWAARACHWLTVSCKLPQLPWPFFSGNSWPLLWPWPLLSGQVVLQLLHQLLGHECHLDPIVLSFFGWSQKLPSLCTWLCFRLVGCFAFLSLSRFPILAVLGFLSFLVPKLVFSSQNSIVLTVVSRRLHCACLLVCNKLSTNPIDRFWTQKNKT